MDSESKKLLEDTFRLTEENNRLLHNLVRSHRIARIMTYIYWIFIIGSAVGAYYLVQPYVNQAVNIYSGAKGSIDKFGSIFK